MVDVFISEHSFYVSFYFHKDGYYFFDLHRREILLGVSTYFEKVLWKSHKI